MATSDQPRRREWRRDQIREWLIEEGYRLLRREGFGSGAENLSLTKVIEAVNSARNEELKPGSIYGRAFEDKKGLQFAILERAARTRNTAEPPAIGAQLEELWASVDINLRSPAEREEVLKRIFLEVARENIQRLPRDTTYVTRLAVLGVTAANPAADSVDVKRIFLALDDGYREIVAEFQAVYEKAARRLRFRIREEDGYTWEQFAGTTVALADGFALRTIINPTFGTFERPTGDDGDLESWTYFGAAVEALVRTMLVAY